MGTIWPVARNKNNNPFVVRKHKNANKNANQPVSTYQLKKKIILVLFLPAHLIQNKPSKLTQPHMMFFWKT